jgi:hypothetical protein
MPDHDIELDGSEWETVGLFCSCGWSHWLDLKRSVTVDDLAAVVAEHRATPTTP